MKDKWSSVDDYLIDRLVAADPALDAALAANARAGLPPIDVAPNQGKLIHLLARMAGARRILEIGTLGGYSSIWLARALVEGGRLITLEANPKHAEIARGNIAAAGLADRVEVRLGPALQSLPLLAAEPPFDVIFIDADKAGFPAYLDWALRLSRPGTVIIGDNVVRDGAVLDGTSKDADIQGIRRLFDKVAAEPRLTATALQTVGRKGWDGLLIALVDAGD